MSNTTVVVMAVIENQDDQVLMHILSECSLYKLFTDHQVAELHYASDIVHSKRTPHEDLAQ